MYYFLEICGLNHAEDNLNGYFKAKFNPIDSAVSLKKNLFSGIVWLKKGLTKIHYQTHLVHLRLPR